jgi:AcrR family transcriptional regulator
MSTARRAPSERPRRPKDRKEQIARVSAEAFSQVGYHAVSMEEIASRIGVSATSLYRHYPSKYDLFRDTVLGLGQQMIDSTAFAEESSVQADPATTWDQLVRALIDTSIRNRASGGLYRWEGRYLQGNDQAALNAQVKLVNRRLRDPLAALRPELDATHRLMLSSAVLSIAGSVSDHHSRLPTDQIRSTLSAIALALRDTDLPADVNRDEWRSAPRAVGVDAGEYEAILRESMFLFNDNGYRETAMEQIAAAAGIPISTIYRFFSGKSAILAAAYRRAADRVSSDVSMILTTATGPEDAVGKLIDAYVHRTFDNPEYAYVYFAERVNVPAEDQVSLHSIQLATVEAWVRQVVAARPDITPAQARFAVHAALALVFDLGRLTRWSSAESSQAVVRHLMGTVLLNRQPLSTEELASTRSS